MARITISVEDPNFVATPSAGEITIFADSTDGNKPKYKTSDGVTHDFLGEAILKIEKLFSDFSGTSFDSEIVLTQIPIKSMLNALVLKMDTEFLTSGFSNVKLQVFLRDINGDATMRDIFIEPAPVPVEGIFLTQTEFSSIDSPNVGTQIGSINLPTDVVLNHNNPVDVIARLKVDSEVQISTEQQLTASYEITDITTIADISDSLSGKHFLISDDSTDYYVWYNTGSSVDPAVVGPTGIQVDIDIDDTADVIAFKTAIVIRNTVGVTVYQFGDKIRCVDNSKNNITDASDITTGFTVDILTQGGGSVKVINDLIQGSFTAYIQFTKLL